MRPRYVCAILEYNDQLLLEARDQDARFAASHCTCFGGRLEDSDASSLAGLYRELAEELQWECSPLKNDKNEVAVKLYVRHKEKPETQIYMANFYHIHFSGELSQLRLEEGRKLILCHRKQLHTTNPPLSPWHHAALNAWNSGEYSATYDELHKIVLD